MHTSYAELAALSGASIVTRGLFDSGSGFAGNAGLSRAIKLSQAARVTVPIAQSPIIYSCVRVNSDALGTIPRFVWLTRDEDAAEASPRDDLVRLLSRPNPLMGGQKFQRALSVSLDLDGGVFLFLCHPGLRPIKPGEFPEELWPVRDSLVTPVEESGPETGGWQFQIRDKKYIFPAESVARIYYPDPHNPLLAFGPTQAAWRAADHLFRAEAFDDALVENGGQMAGVFTHEERRIDNEKRDSLAKSIAQNANAPKNDRKTPVLPAGLKFTPIAFSPVDMQAIDMRKDKRNEIARIYGVPPAMLGELEDANRSSLRELRRVYYENTVAPRVEFIEEELATSFVPLLPPKFADYWIQFDISKTSAMREDMDAQIERTSKLVAMGVSFAEAAQVVGLDHEPVEGEDDRWVSTTLQPVELALNPPEPTVVAPPPAAKAYQERRAAAERFEANLTKHDDEIFRGANKVFRDYLRQQLGKLKRVAGQKGEPVAVRPWRWFTSSGAWSPTRRAYAELMDLEPEREWLEVKGASESEIESLLLGNEEKWGADLWTALEKPIKAALLDAAKEAAQDLGRVAITSTNPRALRHMAMKRVQLSEGPMTVLAERVRLVLVRAMADTSSMGTLSDRVREALVELEDQVAVLREQLGTRAMMIARTESASAANAGRVAQFKASGIARHEWISAGDELVRQAHQIDGQAVPVGEKFSNGLTAPGEEGAPPELVINCRCTTIPVLQEEPSLLATII